LWAQRCCCACCLPCCERRGSSPAAARSLQTLRTKALECPRREMWLRDAKHPPNRLAIDRWSCALDPIERRAAVVVTGGRIGAVREKNLDGFHKSRLGGVVQRRGAPAVGSLPGEALVVDTRPMTQERRDKVGVILAPLVAGAHQPDPRP